MKGGVILKKIISILLLFSIMFSLGIFQMHPINHRSTTTANATTYKAELPQETISDNQPLANSNSSQKILQLAKSTKKPVKSPTTTTVTTTTATTTTVAPTTTTTATTAPTTTTTTTTTAPTTNSTKIIIGYYASWAAYSGTTPDKIDGSKLNFINYAFANIGSDLKIAMGDTAIDPSNFTKLATLKTKYPNLKVIISVGGWTFSGKFSDVALTDTSRTAFADSCVAFIEKYKLDGLDIDWEYPVSGGLSTNVYRTADKTNYTLLMKTLREKLNTAAIKDSKKYYLSFAGGCGTWHANNMELSLLSQYVDFATIMTYDIHAAWETVTDFNAPLFTQSAVTGNIKWSVNDGVNLWLSRGFPANKLAMGIPFYGYAFSGVTNKNNGLYQKFTSGKSISYNSILSSYGVANGYNLFRSSETKVPWLWNGSTFVSFDDTISVATKAQYAVSKNLAGTAIWEISQDTSGALLSAIYNNLR